MRLKWAVHAIFKVLSTLKTLANFLQLFCQYYAIPQRGPNQEAVLKQLVKIDLDKRWAGYFTGVYDFLIGRTHISFDTSQIAFRDYFSRAPAGRYRPPMIS
eukprot:8664711-Alexandrium_andersonii.AAC.1